MQLAVGGEVFVPERVGAEETREQLLGVGACGVRLGIGKREVSRVRLQRRQRAPPRLGFVETTALECQVAERVECSFGGARTERLLHNLAEHLRIALGQPLIQPFARLPLGLPVHGRDGGLLSETPPAAQRSSGGRLAGPERRGSVPPAPTHRHPIRGRSESRQERPPISWRRGVSGWPQSVPPPPATLPTTRRGSTILSARSPPAPQSKQAANNNGRGMTDSLESEITTTLRSGLTRLLHQSLRNRPSLAPSSEADCSATLSARRR